MKILYLDCFSGFDLNKLLGAFVDLGVSCQLIEHELKAMGFECKIEAVDTVRQGVSAKLAAISSENSRSLSHNEVMGILDAVSNTRLKNRAAKVIEIIAQADRLKEIQFEYVDILRLLSAITAEVYLGTERCVTSPLSAGQDKVAEHILKKAAIDIVKESISTTDRYGAAYLSAFASEVSAFCNYDIIKVGYGAGDKDLDIPNVIRAVVAQDGDFDQQQLQFFEFAQEEFSVI